MQVAKRILVDNREPKLFQLLNDIAYPYHLPVGDIFMEDLHGRSYLGERKSMMDFLSSISSGRLYEQGKGILVSDFPFLILEENYIMTQDGYTKIGYRQTRWKYSSVQGHLVDMALKGIAIIPTSSLSATAATIRTLYNQITSEKKFDIRRPKMFQYGSKPSPQVELLCSRSLGMNITLAQNAMEYFDQKPRRFFAASEQELQQVEGIGPARAKRITEVLDGIATEVA